jgi:hypothetical protein
MFKSNNFEIIWNWSEAKNFIGSIKLGEPSETIIQEYRLIRTPEYEASGQELYEFKDKSSISVENELINGVECKSNFFYKKNNLIGLSLEDIHNLIGHDYTIEDDFEELVCIDFDKYGFMIWINKNSGLIESIFCYGK